MGNASLSTYSVILLCLSGIISGQRFPYESPSAGYRNNHAKLNLRNFLGSKLIQRLADNQNAPPVYEPCERRMPYEPPPPLPPPPPRQQVLSHPPPSSFSRGVVSYDYQAQRMQPPMALPPHAMAPPPHHSMGPPPHHSMTHPPHPQRMGRENTYTETVTSSCPCPECAACSECEAANQDYAYSDEPCPCACSEGRCPCEEECPCACREGGPPRDHPSCPCEAERCPCCPGGDSYNGEKDYPDRDQNYDDYPSSGDCPCCCECARNQDAAYPDEPQTAPAFVREHPSYQKNLPPSENYMEEPPESQGQGPCENYMAYRGGPPAREQQQRYQQYEPVEPPQYAKPPQRMRAVHRSFVQQQEMQDSMGGPPHVSPLHHPYMQEQVERHPPPERALHHTEITERSMHRYHERAHPVGMPPMEPCPVHQEVSQVQRVSEWRAGSRMPPPGHPRHAMEEEHHPEHQRHPMYRSLPPGHGRFGRRYRPPGKLNLEYKASNDTKKMYRALQILNPSPELSGEYKCTVSTFQTEESQSKKMVIFVPQSNLRFWHTVDPDNREDNSVEANISKDENVINVTCMAEGVYPEPVIRIFSASRLVSDKSHMRVHKKNGLYDVAASIQIDDDDMDSDEHVFECELSIPEANYTVKQALYVSLENNLGTTAWVSSSWVLLLTAYITISNSGCL